MIIIGESVLELKSAKNILSEINDFLKKNNFINENWNALNILIQNASTVGAIDLNFLDIDGENNFVFFEKLNKGDFKLIYFVGSDNLDFTKKDEFIIYQGSHGDRMAQIADVILPAAAYTEQNGIFINLEGKMQECIKATYPPGDAKEDWKIFNLISKHLIDKENFKNFIELRKDCISKIKKSSEKKNNLKIGDFINEFVTIKEIDYYFSNSIARSSKTMNDCRNERYNKFNKTGT